MRETPDKVSLLVAVLFFCSAFIPAVQGCPGTVDVPASIDDNDDPALSSAVTLVLAPHLHMNRLALLEEAAFTSSPHVPTGPCRAPPCCVSTGS